MITSLKLLLVVSILEGLDHADAAACTRQARKDALQSVRDLIESFASHADEPRRSRKKRAPAAKTRKAGS